MSQVIDILGQPVCPGDICAFTWTDGRMKIGEFDRVDTRNRYGRIQYDFRFKTVVNRRTQGPQGFHNGPYVLVDIEAGHKGQSLQSHRIMKIDPQLMAKYTKAHAL